MEEYPIYATPSDLANYLGVEQPEEQEVTRLLKRASELIYAVSNKKMINLELLPGPLRVKREHSLKLATCAQVEYWQNTGESMAITGGVSSFSIADISMNFGDGPGRAILAPRARQYLNTQSLLYRGV